MPLLCNPFHSEKTGKWAYLRVTKTKWNKYQESTHCQSGHILELHKCYCEFLCMKKIIHIFKYFNTFYYELGYYC